MFNAGRDKDTICALSTAAGFGGISVIRVSGSESDLVTRRICPFLPLPLQSHTIYFGTLRESESKEPIDEVLVSYFAEGRSYTGESTFEISSHGSPAISQMILDELVRSGARIAERGEFTFRAFMTGNIDLVQAEGVLALVESQSKPAAKLALRQLKGDLSLKIQSMEDNLVWALSRLEVSIDFSTEDIVVAPQDALVSRLDKALQITSELIGTYDQGRILKDGLQVSLVGQPNVGKSSLLNAILREDRAIVSEIAGTTRDTVEGLKRIDGVSFTFVDTAGLRETSDPIEQLGVGRSLKAAEDSDFIFYVVDALKIPEIEELAKFPIEKTVVIGTKCDLLLDQCDDANAKLLNFAKTRPCFLVSSKTGFGLGNLEAFLAQGVKARLSEDTGVVIQSRHLQLLEKIKTKTSKAKDLILNGSSEEFSAQELSDALRFVHEILGTEIDEQIIDRVFKDFCIGK
jgi:tRNA modification GTPase